MDGKRLLVEVNGARIREARAAAGFTRAAFALRIGISLLELQSYEHGETIPDPGILLRIANAAGVKVSSLIETT